MNKKVSLILMVVGVLLLIGGVATNFMSNTSLSNSSGNSTNNSSNSKSSSIRDMYIDSNSIIVLTEDDKLYSIGEDSWGELGLNAKDLDESDEIFLMASDVKQFYSTGTSTYYIDSNDDLYVYGALTTSGVTKNAKLLYSNVKEIKDAMMNFCYYIETNDDEVYVSPIWKLDDGATKYCGILEDQYSSSEHVLIDDIEIDSVEFGGLIGVAFLDSNGNCYYANYYSKNEGKKTLALTNVKKISGLTYGNYALTENNDLYLLYGDDVTLIMSDVSDIYRGYFISNGITYYLVESRKVSTFYDIATKYGETSNSYSIYSLNLTNLDKILYMSSSQNRIIYTTTDGKISIYDEGEGVIATLDYSLDSINELYTYLNV